MNQIFPCKRRGTLVISITILKTARNGVRRTHLLNSVSLSYEQFTRYVEFLKARGFIKEHDALLQTTDKGLELIEEFDSSQLIRSVLST